MGERAFGVQGIGYDAGVLYERDFESNPHWRTERVRRDMRAIRDGLGCDTVLVMATDIDRLLGTATIAREEGLSVWIQPRVFDVAPDVVAQNLAAVAERAEVLRTAHGDVSLNLGCELSLSATGFVPGSTFVRRGLMLPFLSLALPLINWRLRRFLARLVTVARDRFAGPISYGAGDWERPDWSRFDVVGLDAYRDSSNAWRFPGDMRHAVRTHRRAGRPVYVFEFGTCAYVGAAERASDAANVLLPGEGGMRVPTSLVRDERVQADYLDELFEIFSAAGVDGTFVWGFSEPALPRSDEPGRDLDAASYGVVAPIGDSWQPKAAFATIARRYGGSGHHANTRTDEVSPA
ncbi:hypothetical protein EXU48_03845 [Occultella glacieicola]|uniref:Abortive infection protein n=1 Tax=Occultella glacieicola TaxID=2518684 RepID=A0ABY2E708_9MICO|nr:hypothetical protein [Occultella glacieicola]TDE97341.1 hypothetical protein EXU48_03845 [Occultella glacieicola]